MTKQHIEILSWVLSCWSLGTMYLMSSSRYKAAWTGSLIGNVGWIYLSFVSGLTGMSFYSIVMLGVASRGLWKTLSVETKHHILAFIGLHHEFGDGFFHENEKGFLIYHGGKSCQDCSYTTVKKCYGRKSMCTDIPHPWDMSYTNHGKYESI